MPASLDRIRKTMRVEPTAQDKGLRLNIEIVAYDNGMITLDTVPLNDGNVRQNMEYGDAEGWVSACEVAVATINEFRRQVETRREQINTPVA